MPPFSFDVKAYGPLVIVTITGDLDLATVDAVERRTQAVDLRHVTSLEVDLTATTFLDSSAIGWLLRLHDRAAHTGTHLIVVAQDGAPPHRTLALTGLEDRLRLVLDRPTRGLHAVAAPPGVTRAPARGRRTA